MNLDDFKRVRDAALASIESLLVGWFPEGVVEGREFRIGSRAGEAGRSMSVCLRGENAGVWSDFAAGESGADLIALKAYIDGTSQGDACKELAAQLGIALNDKPMQRAPAPPLKQKALSPWDPVLPVPVHAGPYPVAHYVRGIAAAQWAYRDAQGRLLGVVYRFVTSDGGKEILPCVYARNKETGKSEWRWMAFPLPRPLYLPGGLRDGLPVLVVEGEKCADAAHALVSAHFDVVSAAAHDRCLRRPGL